MLARTTSAFLAALLLLTVVVPTAEGQESSELGQADALRLHHPGLYDVIVRLERSRGVLFGELAREGEAVRATGDDRPTSDFEVDLVHRLNSLVHAEGRADDEAGAAEAGYRALGARAAEIIRWGQAFQREVISILADPDVSDPRTALANAVGLYRSRPEAALPSEPKDMGVLYDHRHALHFRTGYADLDGLLWAGHWLRLAATEPLTDLSTGADRVAGIDTVSARYYAKLSYGEPPEAFPSELPLAPAIAPGLIWLSTESAMIWDNLSLLLEVLSDVLVSSEATDMPGSVGATLDFFMDPGLSVTDQDEWEIMALRHGIFFQGGYPLHVMTANERNTGGHAAHLAAGGRLVTMPGMPGR